MTVTIVIVTLNRPDCVNRCLDCLRGQQPQAEQVIVVDASSGDQTAEVVRRFPGVEYVRTDVGYGHMTKSRNLGLSHAVGDVIVFLDDDAFAHDGWLAALLEPYIDPNIGGVGGRALNNQRGEETTGIDRIGRLLPNGELTGFFAADPGRVIEVDHLIGCNMSWRRSVLAELGGLRDDYPGTEVREETDLALRVRALGYRLVFQPTAVVTHIGAPQAFGKRFDLRYEYYARRNHAVLLLRNFGPWSLFVWRAIAWAPLRSLGACARNIAGGVARLAATVAGTTIGAVAGLRLIVSHGCDPVRADDAGRAMASRLARPPERADCGARRGVEVEV